MIELLAPAGNLEKLKIAVHYGADAVYFGGRDLNLRANAGNLSEKEIEEAVAFCHDRGARAYVTVNIFAHNSDIRHVPDYLAWLSDVGVDAFIISDPGIFRTARRVAPGVPIHISTQANTTNRESALFWKEQGACRVNIARELTLSEIAEISSAGIDTEVFVHGALCISYSGRCMLSLYMTGRDGNRGECAHPCRYRYALQEEKRPGEYFPVEEDRRGVNIFNSRDLCLIRRLPELADAGVSSFKIEGRMKGLFYVAGVTRIYRAAIDYMTEFLDQDTGRWIDDARPVIPDEFATGLDVYGSRGYTENFIDGPPGRRDMLYSGRQARSDYSPAAVVVQGGSEPVLRVGHLLRPGDRLEYMDRGIGTIPLEVLEIRDLEGGVLKQALGGDVVRALVSPRFNFEEWAVIQRHEGKAA